jgi:hypothetical protein
MVPMHYTPVLLAHEALGVKSARAQHAACILLISGPQRFSISISSTFETAAPSEGHFFDSFRRKRKRKRTYRYWASRARPCLCLAAAQKPMPRTCAHRAAGSGTEYRYRVEAQRAGAPGTGCWITGTGCPPGQGRYDRHRKQPVLAPALESRGLGLSGGGDWVLEDRGTTP